MSFPLVGNDRLKSSVEAFIKADRIPHALIIEGEHGTGKHTLADFITKAAVCTHDNPPCGECDSCHLAFVGSHPDIVFTAPDNGRKNISVDQIRALRQQAFVKAHIADKRVFIIDRADTMNDQAQNALLKVLEEPPAGVIFILIASSRTALLQTIVSRCVTLTPAIPETAVSIKYISAKRDVAHDIIEKALKDASGRIGRAFELLDKSDSDKAVTAATEFLKLLTDGNEWQMLQLLAPFEKDRASTDSLFSALKDETVAQLKKCRTTSVRAKVLSKFYEQLCSYEQLLKTNINLSLLFSAMVCRAAMLNNE